MIEEQWSVGKLEPSFLKPHSIIPLLHHSIVPPFHHFKEGFKMKKHIWFTFISIMVFSMLLVGRSHAKMDILREIDDIVDDSKPNVLLIVATDKYMTRVFDGSGGVGDNEGDDASHGSRFYNLKDVLAGLTAGETGVLETTKDVINYGLMSYGQTGYYTYFHDHAHGTDHFETSTDYQGDTASFGGAHDNLPYYYNTFTHTSGGYPAFNKSPVDVGTAGKLWVKIDWDGTLTQNGPGGASDSNADEVTVIEKFLALQQDGGIAMDDASSGDTRVKETFKNTGDGDNYNDAYDYFSNVVIPGDPNSSGGCYTKNYIIYVGDGFGSNTSFMHASNPSGATNAEELFDLTTGAVSTPVKTFVIGVIDPNASGMDNRRTNLNEIARRGGTDASDPFYGLERSTIPATPGSCGTGGGACNDYAFFVTSKAELKEALLNIAAAIAAGDFVTAAPTATSSGGTFVTNDVGILASSDYPQWRGHLRGVDLVNDRFLWDGGTTLFIPSSDTNLPNAVVNGNLADEHVSWRDTNGDGDVDQPPLTLTVGGDTYQYTDLALYCEDGTDCNSSELTAYQYTGSTITFNPGTADEITYNYKGAFYLKPWGDRKVYTSQANGTLLDFTDSNSTTINTLAGWGVGANYAKAIINFALGGVDEAADGTVDYGRQWLVGDMTNVVPVAIGKPIEPEDNLSGRDAFQIEFAGRDTVVYAGSNDGMFHAFDFDNGDEIFAYVPPDLLPILKTLYDNAMASPDPASYTGQEFNPTDHIYGVASSPKANDVQFADSTWHTVVGSGEGPGGKNYFMLDVTHPSGSSDYSGSDWAGDKRYDESAAPFSLLWHTAQTSPVDLSGASNTLGETWSVAAFGRILDGATNKWTLFVGSGYDDTTYSDSKGEIFHVVNVEDGSALRADFEMDGASSAVQYGLIADSVAIIKKTGSLVSTGYQVDLKGRLWHIDTSDSVKANWAETQLTNAGVLPSSNTDYPIYYSPAVWDYDYELDGTLNLLLFGSGTYDDPEADALPTTRLYFLITDPGAPSITSAIKVDMSLVSGTKLDRDGNTLGTVSAGGLASARLVASPIIFNNKKSGNLEALFLVFDPPTGCSFGTSYLLVLTLGSLSDFSGGSASNTFDVSAGSAMKDVSEGKAHSIIEMGTGKVTGIGMAGGESHAIVGQSGRGSGSSSGFNMAGGSSWSPIGTAKRLFWKSK